MMMMIAHTGHTPDTNKETISNEYFDIRYVKKKRNKNKQTNKM